MESIINFLLKQGWVCSDNTFTNPNYNWTITYVGEGSFYNASEEGEPLYTYRICSHDMHMHNMYVQNVDDFIFWYNNYQKHS